jgi:N-formylglutamate amidohydrolase
VNQKYRCGAKIRAFSRPRYAAHQLKLELLIATRRARDSK